jgi:hypothetical protein
VIADQVEQMGASTPERGVLMALTSYAILGSGRSKLATFSPFESGRRRGI